MTSAWLLATKSHMSVLNSFSLKGMLSLMSAQDVWVQDIRHRPQHLHIHVTSLYMTSVIITASYLVAHPGFQKDTPTFYLAFSW